MSCENDYNSSWGDILDSNIVYTGLGTQCDLLEVRPGMKVREVINVLALAICALQSGDEPIPATIIEDTTLTIDTTGAELNAKYPDAEIGNVYYNQVESIQFTKYPTGWKFEIIELR